VKFFPQDEIKMEKTLAAQSALVSTATRQELNVSRRMKSDEEQQTTEPLVFTLNIYQDGTSSAEH